MAVFDETGSGGLWANGSTALAVTYNLSTSSGMACAGTAIAAAVLFWLPSGGAFGNGQSPFLFIAKPASSGGSYLNGTATNTEVSNSTVVGQAGFWGNGAALSPANYTVSVAQAGLWGSGTGAAAVMYNIGITQAGLWGNGTATWQWIAWPRPSGGGYGNGTATIQGTYFVTAQTKGVWGNGPNTAYFYAIYFQTITPSGVWANGSGKYYLAAYRTMSGGIYNNGTFSVQATYNPVILNGCWGVGHGVEYAIYNVFGMSGGVEQGPESVFADYTPLLTGGGVSLGIEANMFVLSSAKITRTFMPACYDVVACSGYSVGKCQYISSGLSRALVAAITECRYKAQIDRLRKDRRAYNRDALG